MPRGRSTKGSQLDTHGFRFVTDESILQMKEKINMSEHIVMILQIEETKMYVSVHN